LEAAAKNTKVSVVSYSPPTKEIPAKSIAEAGNFVNLHGTFLLFRHRIKQREKAVEPVSPAESKLYD
jgi:hypothetical protein